MAARPKSQLTRGGAVIAFIEKYLRVPEGAHVGRPIRLRDWQKRDISRIYDDGPTRQAIISVARKNGKTATCAALVLAHLIGPEARRNGQIYSAAQSRDQAGIVFALAAKMVRLNPELDTPNMVVVRESEKALYSPFTGARYRALSADATHAYGFSPALVIHDELGQVRGDRSELYDALETAMGSQVEPLSIVISTQAPTAGDLLSKLIDDARTGADPAIKLILYTADPEDDLQDEATWRKANPALGDFLNIEEIRGLAARASRMPSFEAAFRNLHLNQRVSALNQLFPLSIWEQNGGEPDLSAFEDAPVYGGLDLSSRQDLTALVLVAQRDGVFQVWPHFWSPAATLRDRAARDRAPYDLWAQQGALTAVPGVAIDYAFVAQRLADLRRKCRDLRVVRYDRWRIEDLKAALAAIGADVPLSEHGQGFRDMAPAVDALETAALQGNLAHGMHPVLTWNAANAIIISDPAGNRKFEKAKATGRVDGLVALCMAIGAASAAESAVPAATTYKGIYSSAESYAIAFGEYRPKPAQPAGANPARSVDDGATWDPEILKNMKHPDFAKHKARFEAWQDARADRDFDEC